MTKKESIFSISLATILLLTVINSSCYFLSIEKVNVIQWVVLNACAPSSIAFIFGLVLYFISKNRMWLSIAVVPMMFFGTLGMFVFPWKNGTDILVQFSHIVMTLNIALSLWIIIKNKDFKALGIGLFTSILVFLPFISFTQQYCRIHAEDLLKYLGI